MTDRLRVGLLLGAVAAGVVASLGARVFAGPASSIAAMPSFQVDLSDIRPFQAPRAVNNAGVAVGDSAVTYDPPGPTYATWARAARWSVNGIGIFLERPSAAPDGRDAQHAFDISDAGITVGEADAFDSTTGASLGSRPVKWGAAGQVEVLGTLGTNGQGVTSGSAEAINRNGVIAGGCQVFTANGSDLGVRAVRWDAGSLTPTPLDPLSAYPDGSYSANVRAINDAGTIVGDGTYVVGGVNQGDRGMVWAPGATTPTMLQALPTTRHGNVTVCAINSAGVIVGASGVQTPAFAPLGSRAVRWDASGAATQLGDLGTNLNGSTFVAMEGVNDAGVAVGWADAWSGNTFAGTAPVRWDAGQTAAIRLGTLADGVGTALAINGPGVIVGESSTGGAEHAVLWLPGATTAIDLNTLIVPGWAWILNEAQAISDTGFITGTGTLGSDTSRAFTVLVPSAGTYGEGDADFDAKIDFADLLVLAKHYGQSSGGSIQVGDFDLNGVVDFTDLLTLAKHYNASAASVSAVTSATFASDWSLAQTLLPEPALAVSGWALLVAASHPRRRRAGSK